MSAVDEDEHLDEDHGAVSLEQIPTLFINRQHLSLNIQFEIQ